MLSNQRIKLVLQSPQGFPFTIDTGETKIGRAIDALKRMTPWAAQEFAIEGTESAQAIWAHYRMNHD